ncbi:MAG: hypothetical protein R3D89_10135 [Sphingomonadaceae bacterium]
MAPTPSQPGYRRRFRRWQGWLGDPETLALRFEDLVGERGGGDETVRLEDREAIAAESARLHSTRRPCASSSGRWRWDPKALAYVPQGEQGRNRGWREKFKPEHIEAFKRVAATLVELGYESNSDW